MNKKRNISDVCVEQQEEEEDQRNVVDTIHTQSIINPQKAMAAGDKRVTFDPQLDTYILQLDDDDDNSSSSTTTTNNTNKFIWDSLKHAWFPMVTKL